NGEHTAGTDNKHAAKLAGEKQMTPIGQRRRSEGFAAGAEAFAVGNRARLRIEAGQYAVIETAINALADDDRCLHVVTLSRVRPRDGGVRRADFRWRDVACGIESDGLHGAKFSVPTGEIGQAAGHDRRGHRNVAAAVEFPNLSSGCEIISAVVMPAVDEDLCLLA